MNTTNVLNWFTGKGKEKATEAVALIAESVEQGYWVPGASRKVRAILNKANVAQKLGRRLGEIARAHEATESAKFDVELSKLRTDGSDAERVHELLDARRDTRIEYHSLDMALSYGSPYTSKVDFAKVEKGLARVMNDEVKAILAQAKVFCADFAPVDAVMVELDAARPAPVFTMLGLSPTATKTLDFLGVVGTTATTARVCPTKRVQVELRNKEGKVVLDKKTGKPVLVWERVWDFPKGTKFGRSRFHIYNEQCECCGHGIRNPMNWLPILIDDKTGTPIALWTGTDCARKIFGVKTSKLSESDLVQVVPANEGK